MNTNWSCVVLALAACGGGGSNGSGGGDDARSQPDSSVPPVGTISAEIHVNNAGWRPGDRKIAVLVGRANAAVEVRAISDGRVAGMYTSSGLATDEDSGDSYATVDFTEIAAADDYYLYLPGEDLRSYTFAIREGVYRRVGEAALFSFYFQRCNGEKTEALAGPWHDDACHLTDGGAPAGPGSPSHGSLDVHGGWHDAGDYQKTLWARGVPEILWAAELNPGAWSNADPTIEDQVRWELDFYVRMQRPDGHFMTSVKGRGGTTASPASASDEGRVYFDVTSPAGDGWSGGGVTIATATGNAVLALAHASIVFGDAGYATAARNGWAWLAAQTLTDAGERRLRAAAAAAVYRLDATVASAKAIVDGFAWQTWDGNSNNATPGENTIAAGAWHVLANPAAADRHAAVTTGVETVIVTKAFSQQGAYGGMFGGPGNGWDWSWGSSRTQGSYGSNLMMAVHFGVLAGRAEGDVVALAQKYLHHLLGLGPLGMVYVSNLAGIGVEHSSFQMYHAWFSYTGSDGDHGNAKFNGKPTDVDEPLYPYHPDDAETSSYGPPPGLVIGGPNFYYSGQYDLPNRNFPSRAYRDFSVGCDWDGNTCRAAGWELTEPMAAYQGPFVLLVSFFM